MIQMIYRFIWASLWTRCWDHIDCLLNYCLAEKVTIIRRECCCNDPWTAICRDPCQILALYLKSLINHNYHKSLNYFIEIGATYYPNRFVNFNHWTLSTWNLLFYHFWIDSLHLKYYFLVKLTWNYD